MSSLSPIPVRPAAPVPPLQALRHAGDSLLGLLVLAAALACGAVWLGGRLGEVAYHEADAAACASRAALTVGRTTPSLQADRAGCERDAREAWNG